MPAKHQNAFDCRSNTDEQHRIVFKNIQIQILHVHEAFKTLKLWSKRPCWCSRGFYGHLHRVNILKSFVSGFLWAVTSPQPSAPFSEPGEYRFRLSWRPTTPTTGRHANLMIIIMLMSSRVSVECHMKRLGYEPAFSEVFNNKPPTHRSLVTRGTASAPKQRDARCHPNPYYGKTIAIP